MVSPLLIFPSPVFKNLVSKVEQKESEGTETARTAAATLAERVSAMPILRIWPDCLSAVGAAGAVICACFGPFSSGMGITYSKMQ
jgi:hypothetical protein